MKWMPFLGKLFNKVDIFKVTYHLYGVLFHLFVRGEIWAVIEGAITVGLELVILSGEKSTYISYWGISSLDQSKPFQAVNIHANMGSNEPGHISP